MGLRDPLDCSSPGSFVHGIFQARILEWVAMPFPRGSSSPRYQIKLMSLASPAVAGRILITSTHWEAQQLSK